MNEQGVKTVLIVDNDQAVRDTMSKVVELMGYRAVGVERATRALPIVQEGGVDAILLDLNMPGPHGDHLLSYMKNHSIPVPPTIVVSGYLHEERIGPLLRFGVCGILAKPFEVKRLMDELRRALEGEDESRLLFCSQCGASVCQGDHFCRQCGGSLERGRACPNCESPCEPGDRFCGKCGQPLSGP